MHMLPCADVGAAGGRPPSLPRPSPGFTSLCEKRPGVRNRRGPCPGASETAVHGGEQVVPAARAPPRAPARGLLPRPPRPKRPGGRGSVHRPAACPAPNPFYKKKRRQHLPLDTPGGRPGPGRPSSPGCAGALAEGPTSPERGSQVPRARVAVVVEFLLHVHHVAGRLLEGPVRPPAQLPQTAQLGQPGPRAVCGADAESGRGRGATGRQRGRRKAGAGRGQGETGEGVGVVLWGRGRTGRGWGGRGLVGVATAGEGGVSWGVATAGHGRGLVGRGRAETGV